MGHSGAKLSIAWSTWICIWSCGEIRPRQALSPVKFPARKWKPLLISGKAEESCGLPLVNNQRTVLIHRGEKSGGLRCWISSWLSTEVTESQKLKRLQLMLPHSHLPPHSQTTNVFILKTRFFETFGLFSLKNQFGSWTANVTSFIKDLNHHGWSNPVAWMSDHKDIQWQKVHSEFILIVTLGFHTLESIKTS